MIIKKIKIKPDKELTTSKRAGIAAAISFALKEGYIKKGSVDFADGLLDYVVNEETEELLEELKKQDEDSLSYRKSLNYVVFAMATLLDKGHIKGKRVSDYVDHMVSLALHAVDEDEEDED